MNRLVSMYAAVVGGKTACNWYTHTTTSKIVNTEQCSVRDSWAFGFYDGTSTIYTC